MGVGASEFVREVLARASVFAGLDDAALARLSVSATPTSLQGGAWLFRQGDVGDALYVVATGRLDAVVDQDDRPVVVRSCRRGDVFGELAIVCDAPRTASMLAVRDSELWRIERAQVETLLRESPEFALALTRFLGDKVRRTPASAATAGPRPPAVVSVLAVGATDASAMVDAIGSTRSAVVLRGAAAASGHPGEWASQVDAAEGDGRRVVLTAAGHDPAEWRHFCVRQADRVVAVVDDSTSAEAEDVPAGCDLVVVGSPGRRRLRSWLEATSPRAHHLVRGGSDGAGLARAARRVTATSVGLVLSGGGARGMAHLGVLAGLAEAGITVDRVGGTSMGAFVAALAARLTSTDEATATCRAELVARRPFNDYTAPRAALLRGRKARAMLERACGDTDIEELPLDFFAVSADLVSTEVVVHRRGPCADAVAASMSLPGLAPPVRRGSRLLVDGGVLQNLPVQPMLARAEGPVIAVDVSAGAGHVDAGGGLPSIIETLTRSTMLGSRRATAESRRDAAAVLRPKVDDIGLMDFARFDTLVRRGHDAVLDALGKGELDGLART